MWNCFFFVACLVQGFASTNPVSTYIEHLTMVGKFLNGSNCIHKVLNPESCLSDTKSVTTWTNSLV